MRTGPCGLLLLALACALAVAPRRGDAREPGVRVTVDGGVALPTGPDAFIDHWGIGVGVGAGVEVGFTDLFSMWGRAGYTRVGLDEEAANGAFYTFGPPTGVGGGDITLLALQVGLRVRRPSGTVRPYFEAGAGVERISADDIEVRYIDASTGQPRSYAVSPGDETRPGGTVGAGILLAGRSFGVFADVHVDLMLTSGENTQYVPIRVGMIFP